MSFGVVSSDWLTMPNGLRMDGHAFFIGDVHGEATLLEKILEWAGRQPVLGAQELIFTGDLIDRGHENFRTLRLAMNGLPGMARHILPGNHEIQFLRFMNGENRVYDGWLNMGGHSLVAEVHDLDFMEPHTVIRQRIRAALPDGYEDLMRNGPNHLRRGDFLIIHAGVDPAAPDPEAYLALGRSEGERSTHWAWIFYGFGDWKDGWNRFGAGAILHGHNPIMVDRLQEAFRCSYYDLGQNGRLNIDFGCGIIDRIGGVEIHGTRCRYFGAARTT